jgi:hypothetical protein
MGMEQGTQKTVYICTGPYAKVYHTTPKCKGLRNCSGKINTIFLDDIKNKRRPCKTCY